MWLYETEETLKLYGQLYIHLILFCIFLLNCTGENNCWLVKRKLLQFFFDVLLSTGYHLRPFWLYCLQRDVLTVQSLWMTPQQIYIYIYIYLYICLFQHKPFFISPNQPPKLIFSHMSQNSHVYTLPVVYWSGSLNQMWFIRFSFQFVPQDLPDSIYPK